MGQTDQFSVLAQNISICKLCPLYKNRLHAVPGEGNPRSSIIFIGEAPGKEENKQGRPFVGSSGQFLDQLLKSVGWQRSDVYITNIVKDQPPGNRDPLPDEISTCTNAWLTKQLDLIKPKLIVPLGRHSMNYFLPDIGTISQIHGRAFRRRDGHVYFPLYHPAVALYRQDLRPILERDFKRLAKLYYQLLKKERI